MCCRWFKCICIQGNINLTKLVEQRERFYKNDYILEVYGNYTRKIHLSEQVKIGVSGVGNLEEEILGNHGFNISKVKGINPQKKELQKILILSIGGNFGNYPLVVTIS